MNCPHHHVIYNHGLHSYRELPIRIAELRFIANFPDPLAGFASVVLRQE